MKKKYKLKKIAKIIIFIIFLIIIALLFFIFSLFKPPSYSIEYTIDNHKISEYYDSKKELFYYEVNKNDITYNFVYPSKYIQERKLISSISEYKEDNETCITISSEYIKTYPLCHNEKELIDYHLVSSELQSKLDYKILQEPFVEEQLKNYNIYNNNLNLLIWNYKGFNYIHNGEMDFISLFKKDIYAIPLATKFNNYIIIPDYEQEYTYNRIYLIDLTTFEVDTWILTSNISFDSYILGTNNKSLYILDQKNKREYELVPHKKKMRIIATSGKQGIIYNKGEEKKVPIQTLVGKITSFVYDNTYNYKIIDGQLYLSYLDKGKYIKISNNITSIVGTEKDTIYYLVGTILYRYTPQYGEAKLVQYSEWEFNSNNAIFINS